MVMRMVKYGTMALKIVVLLHPLLMSRLQTHHMAKMHYFQDSFYLPPERLYYNYLVHSCNNQNRITIQNAQDKKVVVRNNSKNNI